MYHSPRTRVDPAAPEAAGICDRCGFEYNLCDLPFQFDYRGDSLQSLGIRVCERCLDIPQQQLRPKIVPPDPDPVPNSRPPAWAAQEGFTPNIPVYQLIAGDD